MMISTLIVGCGDNSNNSGDSSGKNNQALANNCRESGIYACKTGSSEPLYPFQWALNYKDSYFKDFKSIWKSDSDPENYDLNVQSLHKEGIKGQGVNVLVLDDGIDITHEDLSSNIDKSMTFNFEDYSYNPTPPNTPENIQTSHGTNVAGMIAAAQNGKGVMGIAPRVKLGGARYIGISGADEIAAYGGADFSKNADVINASFGSNPLQPDTYDTESSTLTTLRALTNLRKSKGAIFVKASGNEFISEGEEKNYRDCPKQFEGILGCEVPAHDTERLEPTAVVVAAANAKGIKATYSNTGPVNWITGLAGEFAQGGIFGEGGEDISDIDGPAIFSTDLQGCSRGYSRSDAEDNLFARGLSIYKGIKNNPLCNYSQMNGTSAATPTISAVTALILQANPNLTWRDVREILRQSARVIDINYTTRSGANRLVDLETGNFLTETGNKNAIQDGMTKVPLELGWQTNGAGIKYSNWYGFGLVNAASAVKLAKSYKAGTLSAALGKIPNFVTAFPQIEELEYGKVTRLGVITNNQSQIIDQFQLRVTGPLCVGSVGIFVKSPSGVISALSTPYNIYYKTGVSSADHYGLGSYAFYGEKATGNWEVFAVSGDKGTCDSEITKSEPLRVEYRIIPKA